MHRFSIQTSVNTRGHISGASQLVPAQLELPARVSGPMRNLRHRCDHARGLEYRIHLCNHHSHNLLLHWGDRQEENAATLLRGLLHSFPCAFCVLFLSHPSFSLG